MTTDFKIGDFVKLGEWIKGEDYYHTRTMEILHLDQNEYGNVYPKGHGVHCVRYVDTGVKDSYHESQLVLDLLYVRKLKLESFLEAEKE
jgi:hypothetical protein